MRPSKQGTKLRPVKMQGGQHRKPLGLMLFWTGLLRPLVLQERQEIYLLRTLHRFLDVHKLMEERLPSTNKKARREEISIVKSKEPTLGTSSSEWLLVLLLVEVDTPPKIWYRGRFQACCSRETILDFTYVPFRQRLTKNQQR